MVPRPLARTRTRLVPLVCRHEGQGYVTEALRRLMAWTFTTLGLTTAVSYIDPGNDASVRVAQALGGRPDPDATPPDADPVLIYRYQAGAQA